MMRGARLARTPLPIVPCDTWYLSQSPAIQRLPWEAPLRGKPRQPWRQLQGLLWLVQVHPQPIQEVQSLSAHIYRRTAPLGSELAASLPMPRLNFSTDTQTLRQPQIDPLPTATVCLCPHKH